MAAITGVPITNPTVSAPIQLGAEIAAPAPQIDAFLRGHQTAITQLATATADSGRYPVAA